MGITIEYESEEAELKAETIRSGGIFADLESDDKIGVTWSSQYNRERILSLELEQIGGKAVSNGGGWMPLSLTNCHSLRQTFGDRLEIGDSLNDWAYDEIERIGSIDNLTSADSDAILSPHFAQEAPAIARVMHAYQRAGTAFCAATRRALLADQPGLGKTLQTISAMVEGDIAGDILVAAPTAAVAITWPDELRTWVPGDEVVVVTGPGKRRHEILSAALRRPRTAKRRWFIVNLEMCRAIWVKPHYEFRRPKNNSSAPPRKIKVPGWWDYAYPELFGDFEWDEKVVETGENGKDVVVIHTREHKWDGKWAGIVVDESHRCLIAHTPHLHSQTQIRAGMAQLKLIDNGIKLALSGTPMRGKPENLWGTLNWLYPERYSAYWEWVNRWFITYGEPSKHDERGKDITIGGLDETKTSLFYDDIKVIMLRRTKKEVRAELPDKLYAGTPLPDESGFITENSPIGHWLEMSPKQAKAYQDITTQAETLLESGVLVANGVLAELTRLKQFATCYGDIEEYESRGDMMYRFLPQLPSVKFDWLVEFFDSLGINKTTSMEPDEDERKVVVASQFTSVLDLYDKELAKKGISTLKITGKVSQSQRKAAKDRWQQPGGPRVFLLNTQAGGVSLTLDMADDLVFLDETWIPDDQEQVEDRIHRVSRMHQVTIHYLRTLGTVEENIALTTGSRERMTKLLIDGERGVTFAKKLLTPIKRPS